MVFRTFSAGPLPTLGPACTESIASLRLPDGPSREGARTAPNRFSTISYFVCPSPGPARLPPQRVDRLQQSPAIAVTVWQALVRVRDAGGRAVHPSRPLVVEVGEQPQNPVDR